MDALPPLLTGGRLVGSRRVEGGWAGREVRVFLDQPRANGGVQLEVSLRVGGKLYLRASRSEGPSAGVERWALTQGEDDPPAEPAAVDLWERLRKSEAFGRIEALHEREDLGLGPQGALARDALTSDEALDLRHEVFVGRMLRWESGRAVPAARVSELLQALLPALEACALELERAEAGKA